MKKENQKQKNNCWKWKVAFFWLLGFLVVSLLTKGFYLYTLFQADAKSIGKKAVDFLNQTYLVGSNDKISLKEAKKLSSGVYEIKMSFKGREFTSYVSPDGKMFFPRGQEMKIEKKSAFSASPTPKKTCKDLKKRESPLLEAFVVSKCPFGLQMERILNEIVKNIPQLKKYIKVEYIGELKGNEIVSMHGKEEAEENLRQICIREEQKEKFWNYISCHIKKGEVEKCLKSAKIDEKKLKECMEKRGLSYAKKDFENQKKYNVTGSPTLILNGERVSEFDFGGRSAEAVKTLLCCGFEKKPDFCSTALSTKKANIGFAENYSGEKSSSGSCK